MSKMPDAPEESQRGLRKYAVSVVVVADHWRIEGKEQTASGIHRGISHTETHTHRRRHTLTHTHTHAHTHGTHTHTLSHTTTTVVEEN